MNQQHQYSKQYFKNMAVVYEDKIKKLEQKPQYIRTTKIPIFQNNNLIDIKIEKHIDYSKIRYMLKTSKEWQIDPHFQIVKNILKNQLKLKKMDHSNDYVEEQLSNFIIQFIKEKNNDRTLAFNKSFSRFYQHIDNLSTIFYIAPLYNVTGDMTEIHLSKNLSIRKVSVEEYSKIVCIQNLPLEEINQYQRRLKFVLTCSIPKNNNIKPFLTATQEFAFILNLLRLFKDGMPQFGRIYSKDSEYLDVNPLELIPSHYENPVLYRPVIINQQDAKKFLKFYQKIQKTCISINKSEFLINSIKRFGMAYGHISDSNKIVDYVISLESLLTDSPGESTLKLAHRTSALCSDTDKRRLWLWEFMKEAYKFRSGIVHKSEERQIKIQSRSMHTSDVSKKLHEITKIALHRMILLLDKFKKQNVILDNLDRSIYDRQLMHSLKKNIILR